ncbi:MAG: cell division protein FtsQ/DivIB [Aquificaceae bacterium]
MREKMGNGLKYFLSVLWFISMALAGYFVPYFTDNIAFFKIRSLHIEGLETIPPQIVVEEVKNLKNNWLFINETILFKSLNKRVNNAIRSVNIERAFTKNGVELKVKIQERRPLLHIMGDNGKVLLDEEGNILQSSYINAPNLSVYAHDINLVTKNFKNIKGLVELLREEIREVYIAELNTVVYLRNGTKVVLPPPPLLDRDVLYQLERIKTYNIQAEEIEIGGKDDVVIIRGEK